MNFFELLAVTTLGADFSFLRYLPPLTRNAARNHSKKWRNKWNLNTDERANEDAHPTFLLYLPLHTRKTAQNRSNKWPIYQTPYSPFLRPSVQGRTKVSAGSATAPPPPTQCWIQKNTSRKRTRERANIEQGGRGDKGGIKGRGSIKAAVPADTFVRPCGV